MTGLNQEQPADLPPAPAAGFLRSILPINGSLFLPRGAEIAALGCALRGVPLGPLASDEWDPLSKECIDVSAAVSGLFLGLEVGQ